MYPLSNDLLVKTQTMLVEEAHNNKAFFQQNF